MPALILTLIVILVLDALVSMTEAAIFSVPLYRAKLLAEKSKLGKTLLSLKESMGRPITTLISLSNLITIVGSIFAGLMAARVFGEKWVGVFAVVLTFLIMVFAEIIPKRIGERYAETIALSAALPLRLISQLFLPIAWLIEKITSPFIMARPPLTSEEEISFLADIGRKEGVIEQYESEFIRRIFKLNDVTAADMMTPKPFVFLLDGNKTLGEMAEVISNSSHSRIPVYDQTPNQILGIVHQKELLKALAQNKKGILIRELSKTPLVVPEGKLGDDLLRDFQKSRQHLAIVVDGHGNMVGIIGLEDVLEELVGEIIEEKDISPELIKRISKHEVLAHGETSIMDLNHFFNVDIANHKTLNGFLLEEFGHLPKTGAFTHEGGLKFIIEKVSLSGIEKVRVIKEKPKNE